MDEIDEVLDDIVENAVIVTCPPGCNGTKDLCIPVIQDAVNRGKKVFIMYGQHVKEKLEAIGEFSFEIVRHNGINVGLWISGKVKE